MTEALESDIKQKRAITGSKASEEVTENLELESVLLITFAYDPAPGGAANYAKTLAQLLVCERVAKSVEVFTERYPHELNTRGSRVASAHTPDYALAGYPGPKRSMEHSSLCISVDSGRVDNDKRAEPL
jgi:hypothetical protein